MRKKEGHVGKFELANNSTLFLDEIGDMPLLAQIRLLRVLQERMVERIGSSGPLPINVRVICATNQNLEHLVQQGQFRRDLFYRLNVIPIHTPSLREHKTDIPILANYWLGHYNNRQKKNIVIEEDVYTALSGYHWPGNVRELKNLIEYLVNIVDGLTISSADLPQHLLIKSETGWTEQSLSTIMDDYEKKILVGLLLKYPSSKGKEEVARLLRLSRATLYRKMQKYNLL